MIQPIMSPAQPQKFGLVIALLLTAANFQACQDLPPSNQELAEQQKRDAAFQIIVDSYSKDLRPGMTRKEVEDYLRSKKIPFQQMCCVAGETSLSDLVKIGTDKKPWFCSEHEVFAAIQFATVPSNERHIDSGYPAFDTDILKRITVFHWLGGCL